MPAVATITASSVSKSTGETATIDAILFTMLTSDDIRDMSVVEVTNALSWDERAGKAVVGGPLDCRMGVSAHRAECATCAGVLVSNTVHAYAVGNAFDPTNYDCVGHFGHIELAAPVYTPMTIEALYDVLRAFCVFCGSTLLQPIKRRRAYALIKRGLLPTEVVRTLREHGSDYCPNCSRTQPKFALKDDGGGGGAKRGKAQVGVVAEDWFQLHATFPERDAARAAASPPGTLGQSYVVTGSRARCVLKKIVAASPTMATSLRTLVNTTHCFESSWRRAHDYMDALVIDALPVMPPVARPSLHPGGGNGGAAVIVHEFTKKYERIVASSKALAAFMTANHVARVNSSFVEMTHSIRFAWSYYAPLQFYVDTLVNSNRASTPPEGVSQYHLRQTMSLATNLKGKRGRFRGNLMGKRVNFSARTVITPDPNIPLDSIALPARIAAVLTIPERVTPLNRDYLERCCMVAVAERASTRSRFNENGLDQKDLRFKRYDRERDGHLAVGQIVERPLRNGDIAVLNRQPTLHGPSMQAVYIIIQKRESIAFGLSKCGPFNADFDGDEVSSFSLSRIFLLFNPMKMNIHIPQTMAARAEALELMMTADQILLQSTGAPCIGLSQDSLLGAHQASLRDAFFDRSETFQLLMHANAGSCVIDTTRIPAPAIQKPVQRWSGKQILSMILPECISVGGGGDDVMTSSKRDRMLVIARGKLLAGVLDKKAVGARTGSLIHLLCATTSVGSVERRQLINATMDGLEMMCKEVLTMRGFSVGIGDMVLSCERRRVDGATQRTTTCRERAQTQQTPPDVSPPMCDTCATMTTMYDGVVRGMDDINTLIRSGGGGSAPETPDGGSAPTPPGLSTSGSTDSAAGGRGGDPPPVGREHPEVIRDRKLSTLERRIISMQDQVRDTAGKTLAQAFARKQLSNAIQAMSSAGSKGNPVNLTQMGACVGGQMIEGHRVADYCCERGVPLPVKATLDGGVTHTTRSREISGAFYRTTAHSLRAYPDCQAGGFAPSSFIDGLKPLGFFFAAQGGRQGLIDTTQNTSRSGDVQRRMIKGLEDIVKAYDGTLRNANQRIIQFAYAASAAEIQRKRLVEANWSLRTIGERLTWIGSRRVDMSAAAQSTLRDEAARIVHAVQRLRALSLLEPIYRGSQGVELATLNNIERVLDDALLNASTALARRRNTPYLGAGGDTPSTDVQAAIPWLDVDGTRADLPAAAVAEQVRCFIDERAPRIDEVHSAELRIRLASKQLVARFCVDQHALDVIFAHLEAMYGAGMSPPGFPAGCVAAQSIGSQATQATLNTFHMSGTSGARVMGVPRTFELIQATDNPKTPIVTTYPHPARMARATAQFEREARAVHAAPLHALERERVDEHRRLTTSPRYNLRLTGGAAPPTPRRTVSGVGSGATGGWGGGAPQGWGGGAPRGSSVLLTVDVSSWVSADDVVDADLLLCAMQLYALECFGEYCRGHVEVVTPPFLFRFVVAGVVPTAQEPPPPLRLGLFELHSNRVLLRTALSLYAAMSVDEAARSDEALARYAHYSVLVPVQQALRTILLGSVLTEAVVDYEPLDGTYTDWAPRVQPGNDDDDDDHFAQRYAFDLSFATPAVAAVVRNGASAASRKRRRDAASAPHPPAAEADAPLDPFEPPCDPRHCPWGASAGGRAGGAPQCISNFVLKLWIDRNWFETINYDSDRLEQLLRVDALSNQYLCMVGDPNVTGRRDNAIPVQIRARLCRVYATPMLAATSAVPTNLDETATLTSILHSLRRVRLSGPKNTRNVSITTIRVGEMAPSATSPRNAISVREDAIIEAETPDFTTILGMHDVVDVNRTTTSDVQCAFRTLGISAARKVLVRELKYVVASSSSYIDPRHIGVLADTMCSSGAYAGFTPNGMAQLRHDPLLNASFQEQDRVLRTAALNSEYQPISSAAASICVGQLACGVGTAAFSTFLDVSALGNAMPNIDPLDVELRQANAKRSRVLLDRRRDYTPSPPSSPQCASPSKRPNPYSVAAGDEDMMMMDDDSKVLFSPPRLFDDDDEMALRATSGFTSTNSPPSHRFVSFMGMGVHPNTSTAPSSSSPLAQMSVEFDKVYAPTSPAYTKNVEYYSPSSPSYMPSSPLYSPSSPAFLPPTSPLYSPTSPSFLPPTSPAYSPSSPSFLPPTSPAYSPSSPAYSPSSPAYSPSMQSSFTEAPRVPTSGSRGSSAPLVSAGDEALEAEAEDYDDDDSIAVANMYGDIKEYDNEWLFEPEDDDNDNEYAP